MKILMICDVLFPQTTGGAGRFARELANALIRRGGEVHFFARSTPESPLFRAHDTDYYPQPNCSTIPFYHRVLQRLLNEFRPDILHVHQPLPAFLYLPRKASRPVVQTFYSSWPEELRIKASRWPRWSRRVGAIACSAIERRTLCRADVITVLSHYSRSEVGRLYSLPAAVIPGGVDPARFKPCRAPNIDGITRLVTVRNLVPRMGLFELVEAMLHLPANIRLEIGGDGPLRSKLDERVLSLGLRERILLRGHIPDEELPGFYSSADLFILPTVAQEGFGLVILESLSCGTPVLGTRIGAIPELLEGLNPAWLIPEPTPESIAATVLSALRGPIPGRSDLHRWVAERFDWDMTAERYEALYTSLV